MGVDELVSGGDVNNPTYESVNAEETRFTPPGASDYTHRLVATDDVAGTGNWGTILRESSTSQSNPGSGESGYFLLPEGVSLGKLYDDGSGESYYEMLKNFGPDVRLESEIANGDVGMDVANGGTIMFQSRDSNDNKTIRWQLEGANVDTPDLHVRNLNNYRIRDGTMVRLEGTAFDDRAQIQWSDGGNRLFLDTIHSGTKISHVRFQQVGSSSNGFIDVVDDESKVRHAVYSSAPPNAAAGDEVIQDGTNWDPAGTGQEEKLVYLNGEWHQINTTGTGVS